MKTTEPVATRRQVITGLSAGAAVLGARRLRAQPAPEISKAEESIHQEVLLKASPERVYKALTDAREFHKAVLLSAAVRSGMVKMDTPTQISREAGGPFALFGGFVVGRQIELVPNVRIVQAWRPQDWQAGVYSIARFELSAQASATRLVFDHTGFPKGQAQELLQGWNTNYWQPLEKILS